MDEKSPWHLCPHLSGGILIILNLEHTATRVSTSTKWDSVAKGGRQEDSEVNCLPTQNKLDSPDLWHQLYPAGQENANQHKNS